MEEEPSVRRDGERVLREKTFDVHAATAKQAYGVQVQQKRSELC